MRELMVGVIVVGLIAGIVVGRSTERARRSYKDWGTARTALKKGRTILFTEVRRAIVSGLLIAAVLIGVFVFLLSDGSGS